MKKLVCLVLALLLVLPTGALAFRDRVIVRKEDKARNITSEYDIFCMDYSKMMPGDETGFTANNLVKITTTTGLNGKEQSALCVEDNVAGDAYSGTKIQKNFTGVSKGIISFETQFKFEKRTDPFQALAFCLRSGTSQACRFMVRGAGDGYLLLTDEAGKAFNYEGTTKFQPGVWYTLRVEVNLDAQLLQTELTIHRPDGKYYTNKDELPLHNTFKPGSAVDNFFIETRQYDGFLYFDYIKVEKDNPWTDFGAKKPKPKPIEFSTVPVPGQRLVPGITNVSYNGEYMYFTQAPKFEGDDLVVTLRNAIKALGFKFSYDNGKYIGTKGDSVIEVTPGSTKVKYNGKDYTIGKAPTAERIPMVSITDLAEVIGASCSYDSANNVYVITDKEVAQ